MKLLKLLIIPFFSLIVLEGYSQDTNYRAIIKTDTTFTWHYLTYPQIAKEFGIQGTVNVYFEVDSTCAIKNIKITNSLCSACDETLIKDIKKEEIYLKRENKSKCTTHIVKLPLRYTLE
jgi:hypothetical protein